MIYPTLKVQIYRSDGFDTYGQDRWMRLRDEKVAPVRLSFRQGKTTVRTDSASSKGHAIEETAQVVFLAVPNSKIQIGDKIIINGNPLKVNEIHPRYTVTGIHDHNQVFCLGWK